MIAAVDVETQGLKARPEAYIIGCLTLENGTIIQTTNPKELYEAIIKEGRKQASYGKSLKVYAHNHEYDFYTYMNLQNEGLKIYNTTPFIAAIEENGKEIIKLYDSKSLYMGKLEDLGEILGIKKLKTPAKLLKKNKQKWNKKEWKELEEYNKTDTIIVIEFIKKIKEMLKEENIRINHLITISQVAMNYLTARLRKSPELTKHRKEIIEKIKGRNIKRREDFLFFNAERGQWHRPGQTIKWEKGEEKGKWKPKEIIEHGKIIQEAQRYGRNEAWQTGEFENTEYYDCNSLFPYAIMNMRIPDLRTEKRYEKPTRFYKKEQLLKKIGISKAIVYNKNNKLGVLPIRDTEGIIYPGPGKYLAGNWTNLELRTAEKEGYEIKRILSSIIYKEAPINPFKKITKELYEKKRTAKTEFERWFYKSLLNHSYGKLAQTKLGKEIIIDSCERSEEYTKQGFDAFNIEQSEENYIYERSRKRRNWKKHYAPTIPCMIRAYGRMYMYEQYKKIKKEDLLYTDCDSILTKKAYDEKLKLGKEVGEFKKELTKARLVIYTRKTYQINNEIRMAGIRKTAKITNNLITTTKMITLKVTKDLKKVGKFKEETRNLKTSSEEKENKRQLSMMKEVFIDEKIEKEEQIKIYKEIQKIQGENK